MPLTAVLALVTDLTLARLIMDIPLVGFWVRSEDRLSLLYLSK
jgi:hypothetical protein